MSRLRESFTLILEAAPGWTIARSIILLLQGLLPLISLYFTKLIIDTLASSIGHANSNDIFRTSFLLLAGIVVASLGLSVCKTFGEMIQVAQSQRIADYVEGRLYKKAIEIDLECYENSRYYDILRRAQQEASFRPEQILQHSTSVLQGGISIVAVLALLISLNWLIAIILILATIPAMLIRLRYSGVMYQWQRRKTEIQRQANYFSQILATNQFAKEIRIFNIGSFFLERFLEIRQSLYREKLTIVKRRALSGLIAQAVSALSILIVYGFIIEQTIRGVLDIGDLVLYQQAFKRGQDALALLVQNLSFLYEDNLFLVNLYEFFDLQSKQIISRKLHSVPKPIKNGIHFENVSFSYPGSSRIALKDINLKISPGQTIALVGENGSGKTTLIKLLCRLYDVDEGKVTIDGIDIRDIDVNELRRQISIVFQDFARYNITAQENIWLGDNLLPNDDERIFEAARHSGADEVFHTLERSYQTVLGKQFGQGEELSGGQWQKVALARAFLRDSQIIVLDEPTSAMDPKSEEKVFSKFRELVQGQSAILVTHRLSTIIMADCIYVLSEGSIAEQGTHQDLMQKKGLYADLFETQAKKYRL